MASSREAGRRPSALLGSAKIDIRHLRLRPLELGNKRTKLGKDEKNIQRLVDIFLLEECLREDPSNRVPVLINKLHLEGLLRLNQIAIADLQGSSLPYLKSVPNDINLLLLHGYHRLQAGERYLPATDQWWGVNFYSAEDTPEALLNKLCETNDNAKPYDDGTIFYHLRRSQILKKKGAAKKWMAKFPESKRRDYRQLQRQDKLVHLRGALDQFIVMPGIWPGLLFGTFHRVLTLRCIEVRFRCTSPPGLKLTEPLRSKPVTWRRC
jgi:Protein of unknown function (DUF3723)